MFAPERMCDSGFGGADPSALVGHVNYLLSVFMCTLYVNLLLFIWLYRVHFVFVYPILIDAVVLFFIQISHNV